MNLKDLSSELRATALAAQSLVVAIRNSRGQHLAGISWQDDVVITSEQAVGNRENYTIVQNDVTVNARIVGRDCGTNVLALRTERPLASARPQFAEATLGDLVLAFGASAIGIATARLGLVNSVAPKWHSRAGGLIDARIDLDIRLARTEEGGPVLLTNGGMIGMSTFGAAGEVLVIPNATIDRVVPELLQQGHVRRGWLGLGLQPIAIPEALRPTAGSERGMIVMTIAADAPGAKAGVTPGDILISLDGTPIHRLRELAAKLDSESVGKSMQLSVLRGGHIVATSIEITSRPPA
jgi:S1-C subfamily serine protease